MKNLRKLVHLFNEGRKRCCDTNVDQILHVLHCLLISQVQSELVLHLNTLQTSDSVAVLKDTSQVLGSSGLCLKGSNLQRTVGIFLRIS